jgi:uncharacterized protein
MKFTRELPANIHLVRRYEPGTVHIGERVLHASCLFNAKELVADWTPKTVADLTAEHFATAFAWQPEIILLGTGVRQQFPPREIHAAILARGIGFEVMDTGAACRTYNVLVSEDRRAVAALIL